MVAAGLPRPWLLATLLLCAPVAWGQSSPRTPHVGYLYPAGGRQGTQLEIIAGGQFLRGASDVFVSGPGVHASVVTYMPPLNNMQQQELRRRLAIARQKRRAEQGGPRAAGRPLPARLAAASAEIVPLPDDPRLRGLDGMSLPQLQALETEFLDRKRQPNAQIGETVFLEIKLDPGAAPGKRELRLRTPQGLTNPLPFQVGTLAEVREQEPNDPASPSAPALNPPAILNGQIRPGDVDRFRFHARKGQSLVIAAEARRLIPYLADAVPGWFQATLALYDAAGRQVAFADDYRFDPDPVLLFKVPADGDYQLEVRDAIYRGREDFVYRIAVGELPFITSMYPLGGREGEKTVAHVAGWNLPTTKLDLDTRPGGGALRQTLAPGDTALARPMAYAVDGLPESAEKETNDTIKKAQRLALPRIVNGRIGVSGDVDVFRFQGRTGEDVVVEVQARRLGSPLDALVRLTDASGKVIAWNDDLDDKAAGLETHHADAYLRARLPQAGVYCVQVSDAQRHGGEEYGYRLRIGPPQPDFALRMTPSSLSVPAGRAVPVVVHALRRDGFDGAIDVSLAGNAGGFSLAGARIPAGRDSVRVTLSAPGNPPARPVALRLEGRARIGATTIVRPVVPAEDMMQAFAYMHLVPSRELLVAVVGPRRPAPLVEVAEAGPVRIPAGGTARVRITAPRRGMLETLRWQLSDPPKGVRLQNTTAVPGGLALVFVADATAPVGAADNLIVEAFTETTVRRPNARAAQNQRVSLGVLPAIPFEIVRR